MEKSPETPCFTIDEKSLKHSQTMYSDNRIHRYSIYTDIRIFWLLAVEFILKSLHFIFPSSGSYNCKFFSSVRHINPGVWTKATFKGRTVWKFHEGPRCRAERDYQTICRITDSDLTCSRSLPLSCFSILPWSISGGYQLLKHLTFFFTPTAWLWGKRAHKKGLFEAGFKYKSVDKIPEFAHGRWLRRQSHMTTPSNNVMLTSELSK